MSRLHTSTDSIDSSRFVNPVRATASSLNSDESCESLHEFKQGANVTKFYWTIRQSNVFRMFWDYALGIIILYVATLLPYKIAFLEMAMPAPIEYEGWRTLDHVITIFFGVDLCLNFFFTYRNSSGKEVRELRFTVRNYLRGSFLLDLLASIPEELVSLLVNYLSSTAESDGAGSEMNQTLKLMRMQKATRLVRLLRLSRLVKVVSYLNESEIWIWLSNMRCIRMLKIVLFLFLFVHLFACLWYCVASFDPMPKESWVGKRELRQSHPDGTPVTLYDLQMEDGDPWNFQAWLNSVYFVMTVVTTVGYGDMSPSSNIEVIIVIILMILGVFLHSSIMSQALGVASSADQKARDLELQRKLVQEFAEHTELKRRTCIELSEAIGVRGGLESYDREQMKLLLTNNGIPRDIIALMATEVFNGKLANNLFVRLCTSIYQELPIRFTLMLSLICHERFFDPHEIVYYYHDHAWNVFMVYSGVFAGVAVANKAGGIAAMTPGCMAAVAPSDSVVAERRKQSDASEKSERRHQSTRTHLSLMPTLTALEERGSMLSPYQLFAEGNFFGEAEILLDEAAPRHSCVRCESLAGALLVVHKDDLFALMLEFQPCAEAWRLAARRREEVRKAKLRRLWRQMTVDELAVRTIEDCYCRIRDSRALRAHGRYRMTKIERGKMEALAVVRPHTESVPTYVRRLQGDVTMLQDGVSQLQGAVHSDLARVRRSLDGLKREVSRLGP